VAAVVEEAGVVLVLAVEGKVPGVVRVVILKVTPSPVRLTTPVENSRRGRDGDGEGKGDESDGDSSEHFRKVDRVKGQVARSWIRCERLALIAGELG